MPLSTQSTIMKLQKDKKIDEYKQSIDVQQDKKEDSNSAFNVA